MKVALIWPKGFDPKYVVPLSIAYLKQNVDNSKHDVRLFDCAIQNVDADSAELKKFLTEFKPDIVGTTCWSITYDEAIKILNLAKQLNKNVVTLLGGVHVTSYPDLAIKESAVDYVFRGESEVSFRIFLDEFSNKTPNLSKVSGLVYRSNGEIIKNPVIMPVNLDAIKFPDYNDVRLKDYLRKGYKFNTTHYLNAPIWVTRGCPYRCTFCSAPQQNGKQIRKHSVKYMEKWIKYLYYKQGIRHVNIIDDNFTFDMNYAKEFCRAMIKLNLKELTFGTPNGIRIQRVDEELLKLMKRTGWENVVVAPESGSEKTLKRMQKDLDPNIIPGYVDMIKKAGLKVHAFFIIGYPGETIEDIKKTQQLLRKCRFNFFFLNNFQPLPGTPVYDELVKNKEINPGLLPKNYSGGERVYTPEGLKDFNFPAFVLKEYLYLAITNPLNIPYMIKLINPSLMVRKVLSNLKNMVTGGGTPVNLMENTPSMVS